MPRTRRVAVGLDLAGVAHRTTGFCRLAEDLETELAPLHSDAEIVARTLTAAPGIVSIDAPLSLPRGRATIEDRTGPHLRECDRELARRHIRFFPITLGPMRILTRRGLEMKRLLEAEGLRVIESYPGGAQDVLGLPRKKAGTEVLRRALRRFGFHGDVAHLGLTHDELDAVASAYVGLEELRGHAEALGDPAEGLLYLPRRVADVSAGSRRRSTLRALASRPA